MWTDVSKIKKRTGLIFGLVNTGYEQEAVTRALAGGKTLVITATSPSVLSTLEGKFSVVEVQTHDDLTKVIAELNKKHDFKSIVFTGLAEYAVNVLYQFAGDKIPQQQHWQNCNKTVRDDLRALAGFVPTFYVTCDLRDTDEKKKDSDGKTVTAETKRTWNINPGLLKYIVGDLHEKVYTYGTRTGELKVQTNSILAMAFKPVTKSQEKE